MNKKLADLNVPPSVFLRQVRGEGNVKTLLNAHRILHSWMKEIMSNSPTKTIGKGWSPQYIKPAHDLVVQRIKQLKPDFNHDSPITGALNVPPLQKMMVIPNYISLVGSTVKEGKEDSDTDILIRDNKENGESAAIRMYQVFGKDTHIIFNPQGPHDEPPAYQPLYHMVLVPVSQWKVDEAPSLTAAMEGYRTYLGPFISEPSLRHRIIVGAGRIRRKMARAMDAEDAEEMGINAALWVLSGDPIDQGINRHAGARSWSEELLWGTAKELYDREMIPIGSIVKYRLGVRRMRKQIEEWAEKKPFSKRDEALYAARELALQVAEDAKK